MPRTKGELWDYFYQGPKQNSSHYKAYCLGCVKSYAPAYVQEQADINMKTLNGEAWFKNACDSAGSILGEKNAMVAHILGGERPCHHASEAAKKKAGEIRKQTQNTKRGRGDKDNEEGDGDDEYDQSGPAPSKKRKAVDRVEKKQSTLDGKVFKGIGIPFTEEQEHAIHIQFLRATISANLPFHWVENPEVIKLFLLFRSCAGDVIPSAKQLSNRILNEEHGKVEKELKKTLKDKDVVLTCDGVKDVSKNSLTGVNISVEYKPHLVDLYNSTPDKKDGQSMCEAYIKMIDSAEKVYGCHIVALGTDNDGGSRAGRVFLEKLRPWLFLFPCGAHQGQLTLCDYFKVNPEASDTAEEATDLIGWLNNHGRVRSIFNEVQSAQSNKVLTYLVANLTRWTTHQISFDRLEEVKQPLRTTSVSRREDVIAAQVGAEKNAREVKALREAAEKQLDLIDNSDFWRRLSVLIEDIEPISFATNICQSDHARPDVVLLAFVGMFLYFKNHSNSRLSAEMTKRLERRWKGFDQNLMVSCLILNPYERLERFGPNANANPFGINALITNLFRKYISRSIPESETEAEAIEGERHERIKSFSVALTHYLSLSGPFKDWPEQHVGFQEIHGTDPNMFWIQMKSDGRVVELANFALTVFSIVLNTAGNERQFSDVKIKKTRLRNRIGLSRLGKMIKVGADIKQSQFSDGLKDLRKPRQNHDEERLSKLLEVPRYAEILDSEGQEGTNTRTRQSQLVTNRKQWRREFAKWVEEARRQDEEASDMDDSSSSVSNQAGGSTRSWLPRSLDLLFGGKPVQDQGMDFEGFGHRRRTRRQGWSEEALRMELLAQEEQDEILDDGALEGSGDEYNGRGYNPSTQEFAQRHGLPLVDVIWPDGKTGPDEDEDSWYDCQETQDKNSDDLDETPFPGVISGLKIV
ncbi:hypothetical protein K435DRAFT_965546 [Dendrothele bispora CBS 962.96]|uniref:Uncharacterized protein n=1 Tax=Dendrothele bispora (strain CBS 962.96) TaxID=1314807 RepID=A0A4S8M531_DENBC|nr:hypothetical protein K435DRAFT_965546 [Dendrothele bispora CBS 962.96]